MAVPDCVNQSTLEFEEPSSTFMGGVDCQLRYQCDCVAATIKATVVPMDN